MILRAGARLVCGVLDVNGVLGLCFISSGGGVGLLCCIIVDEERLN